ncbi:MAG: hypothetical protein H0W69_01825 [Gemmatimonadaceae bacterium]|nr:hypothetical protein [Gemmatimonadaceae bacterium]
MTARAAQVAPDIFGETVSCSDQDRFSARDRLPHGSREYSAVGKRYRRSSVRRLAG